MADKLLEAIADVKNAGVDTRSIDYVLDFDLGEDSHNISAGMLRGLGPRYGMAPLVAQSIDEAVDAYGTCGLLGSTSSDDTRPCHDVYRVYGIINAPLIDQTIIGTAFTTIPVKKSYYWLAVGINDASLTQPNFFSFVPLGESIDATTYGWTLKAALGYGLVRPMGLSTGAGLDAVFKPFCYRLNFPTNGIAGLIARTVWQITQTSGTLDYASIAVFSVPGQNIQAPYLGGTAVDAATSTASATVNLNAYGTPNFVVDRKFKNTKRKYSLYNLRLTTGLDKEYIYDATPLQADLLPEDDQGTGAQVQGTWVTNSASQVARLDGTAASGSQQVLWYDPDNYLNTEHTFLLAAIGKPVSIFIQSWQRSEIKTLEQAVDLRNRRFKPAVNNTTRQGATSSPYTESNYLVGPSGGTPMTTCWSSWPAFIDGTAGPTVTGFEVPDGTEHVGTGPANSGILRANTVYEFAFSIYDKQLGNESNVGQPAKFQTGSADFVALSLFIDELSGYPGGQFRQRTGYSQSGSTPISYVNFMATNSSNGSPLTIINHIQFRVYFREYGSFEWLPALQIDAARYFLDPNLKVLWACTGTSVGTTGGQPGGFNDYSELPDDAYTCVLVWKQRVFWLSDKSMVFSETNNAFSYPLRNGVPIQQGQYKGAIVHNYPGEAEQDSRLIVFGTREIYVGKFTGERSQMAVQVDPDNLATFFVDGSDFVLNPWTSVTAFSYRSACVADGILYYWGPQGVYRDDGRDTPTKISDSIEPDIFNLYAKQRTDDIHCTYSEQTKEIIWFYFDNSVYSTYSASEEQTKLLIYNTQTEEFFFGGTSACIDGSQKIISGDGQMDLVRETGGDRTVVFARVSKASTGIQQAYFFDYRNRAGDMRYGLERMVNQIATPSAGTRRLTLPNGATGISVGDLIATDQINAYTNDQTSSGTALVLEDFIGKVTAVNTTGTHYIDVLMPSNIDSAFSTAGTLGPLNAFPIYVNKTILAADGSAGNAFSYAISSQYWCPFGMKFNAFWTYCHFLFKITLLKAEGLDETFGVDFYHRSPTSLDYVSEFMMFGKKELGGPWTGQLNSDGAQQIYHPLDIGNDNFQGQGLKLKIAGLHYGHKWVLQYLAMYGVDQTFDFLKQFEG